MEGSLHKYHVDDIAEKGMNSLSHNNLVRKLIPMLQAVKIPDAKAAVDKGWEKLEKIPAWQLAKVRNKKDVIAESKNQGRTVHFASSMDLCHRKKSELELQFQKYKGRVVLRCDVVNDDSGSYAVFTEQGSSASQMTAPNVMDVFQGYQDAQDKQQTECLLTPKSKWKMHHHCSKFRSQNVKIFGYVYQFFMSEICTVIL